MHKGREKLIAIFLCILLLSNFGLSVVLAAESLTVGGLQVNTNGERMAVTTKSGKATLTIPPDTLGLQTEQITFTPRETGVYTITMNGMKNGKEVASQINYSLYLSGGGYVRLAARYTNGNYYIITGDTSDNSTTIDVILEAGKSYQLEVTDSLAYKTPISMTVEKKGIAREAMAKTDIPSCLVSDKKVDLNNRVINRLLEPIDGNEFKLVSFSNDEIKDYIANGVENQKEFEDGSFLEGLLVDVIIGFGTVFIDIVSGLVGANVKLTIDNIIFNRYDDVVIDLTPLGGIPVQGSNAGIFQNENVGAAIKVLYNSLKNLSFVVYVIMLLYIGVKILYEIGGKNQKKYLKYLEYWVSGLIIFMLIPYCLPVIPATNNALVEVLESKAKKLNANYTVDEVLERLGGDKSLLGEDAEIVELKRMIDERIEELNAQIYGEPTSREEAQAGIKNTVENAVSRFNQLTSENQAILQSRVNDVLGIIDDNCLEWSEDIQEKYEEEIAEVREYIFENSEATSEITTNAMSRMPSNVASLPAIREQIESILKYIRKNAGDWENNKSYNLRLSTLKTAMNNRGLGQYYGECFNAIESAKNSYLTYASSAEFQGLERVFINYKNAMIYEEIEELKDLKNSLSNDVMTMLKEKAQEDNRLVYAVAWAILVFQMFAILFMYYKRVITLVILIIIFPLIMAFYVIDKAGDGKSQSLDSWIREFTANILVQLLHAVIYIILVNTGIEICDTDPENNWFFLILAVCFLFPGERILRSILGLNASSLGGLKNNVGAAFLGVLTLGSVAQNSGRKLMKEAKDIKKNGGIVNTAKKRYEDAMKQEEKAAAAREQKTQERRKKAEKARKQREALIKQKERLGTLTMADEVKFKLKNAAHNAGNAIHNTKKKINGMKPVQATKAAYRTGKMTMKKVASGARKAVGLTMGAVEGMENFGEAGAASAFATATQVSRDIGGFKAQPKVSSSADESKSPSSQYTSQYSGNQKIAGGNRMTPGNSSPVEINNTNSYSSGNSVGANSGGSVTGSSGSNPAASRVQDTKTTVKTHIQNINNNKTNP